MLRWVNPNATAFVANDGRPCSLSCDSLHGSCSWSECFQPLLVHDSFSYATPILRLAGNTCYQLSHYSVVLQTPTRPGPVILMSVFRD